MNASLSLTALLFTVCALGAAAEPADRLEEFRAENGLSAVVAGVWKGDAPLFREAVGQSQTGVRAELDMKFRAGGVCLSSLAAVLLQSADEGLVSLDDPVGTWLPFLPNADRVTLRMLALCTSGYGDYVGKEAFEQAFAEDPFRDFTAEELIDYGLSDGELYPPGEGWAYTHTTFVILGLILEEVHDRPVPALLRERVFEPLGLSDTVYTPGPSLEPPVLHAFTTERGVFEESTFWNPSWTSYSGSLASTLDDVSLIIRAIGRGTLFSEESRETLTAPRTVGLGPNTPKRYYAMGIGVVDGWLVQNPNFGGYQGIVAYDPETDTSIVGFVTLGKTSDPGTHHGMKLLPLLKEMAATTPRTDELARAVGDAIPRIETYAAEAMDRTNLPGLGLAVVFRDEAMLMRGFGTRRAGEDLPVDANTVFQLASLSKPMTSTVLAAAVDRGGIGWRDPVADHGAGLVLSDPWLTRHVGIADLLSHRSGLPDHAGDLLEDLGFSRETILKKLALLEPAYPFRAGYAYTNFGFTAAAEAAARAADRPWPELARDLVFRPLGMESSSFRFADYRDAENRADIHVRMDGGHWRPLYQRDPDPQAPAGGLSTNLRDYARWMRMQLADGRFGGKTIVSPGALAETRRPHVQKGYDPETHRASYYALGWGVDSKEATGFRLSHSGAFDLGVRTAVYLYPDAELGIAVFTNGGSHGVPEAIAFAFEDMVFRGVVRRDWIAFAEKQFALMSAEFHAYEVDPDSRPADPDAAADFERYTGTYRNAYFGPLEVRATEDGLAFRLGQPDKEFELKPWDGDTFLFQPRGENAGGPGTVRFERPAGETAERVRIPYFDELGMGTFVRSGP